MARTPIARNITFVGPRAVLLGTLRSRSNGAMRKVYRVPVRITTGMREADLSGGDPTTVEHLIIAHSPADAAAWAETHLCPEPESEVVAFGPHGGKVRRWVGTYSWIWTALCRAPRPTPIQHTFGFMQESRTEGR